MNEILHNLYISYIGYYQSFHEKVYEIKRGDIYKNKERVVLVKIIGEYLNIRDKPFIKYSILRDDHFPEDKGKILKRDKESFRNMYGNAPIKECKSQFPKWW